jgi:serine/threonine protein kinase
MSTYNSQTGRLPPHSMLQQRYIIIEQVGRGGMGAVYKATDTRMASRPVAVKELSQAHLGTEELAHATARFKQEADMLEALSHPNLPHIYDAFSEQGRSYLVMDFIEGKTLHQLLHEADSHPLPLAQVLLYANQMCNVLSYLHQQTPPIIFRDVKPTNIMVTISGHIFLIDFGIARFFKEGQVQDTILLGSPGYASPEQHGIGQTGPRSDIYGLGATLHYCLSGIDPYYSKDRFIFPSLRQYNTQASPELDQLIQSMVAQDERQRPATALEVQQILSKINQQAADHTSSLSAAQAPTQYIPPQRMTNSTLDHSAPTDTILPTPSPVLPQTPAPGKGRMKQAMGHILSPGLPSPIWSRGFTSLFFLLLIVTGGSSIFAFNFLCPSAHIVESSLAAILALSAFGAGFTMRGLVPRAVMFGTGFFALAACFAFTMQAMPDITALGFADPTTTCHAPGLVPQGDFYNLLLGIGLLATAALSLIWPLSRLFGRISTSNRVVLLIAFIGALVCVIIQLPLQDLMLLKHLTLLTALIILLLGTVLVARIWRVEHA